MDPTRRGVPELKACLSCHRVVLVCQGGVVDGVEALTADFLDGNDVGIVFLEHGRQGISVLLAGEAVQERICVP